MSQEQYYPVSSSFILEWKPSICLRLSSSFSSAESLIPKRVHVILLYGSRLWKASWPPSLPPSKPSERPHFSWFSVGAKSSDEVHWIHQERPTDRGTALLATHPSVPLLLLTLTRHTCCAYIFDMGGLIRRQGMSKKSMQNTREKFRPSFSWTGWGASERLSLSIDFFGTLS